MDCGIIEPPKATLRAFLLSERQGIDSTPLPRCASALFYHRGTSDLFLAEVNLSSNHIEKIEQLESRIHTQADIDEAVTVRDACLQHPKVLDAIKKFKVPEDLTVVCDTWPYGRDHGHEFPRLVQASHTCWTYYQFVIDRAKVLPLRTERPSGFKSL